MSSRAANRYAKALLDLALEKKQEEIVQKDMQFISDTIASNNELQMLLVSPIFKITDKKAAIKSIFKNNSSNLSNNLIDLLATNKRMPLLQEIAKQYNILFNEVKETVKALVTTSFPIDDSMRKKVLAKATSLVGNKKISLENKVDENIIGGFILRVGDVQIDASILNKLNNLKRELSK
jgi:F-type H+-transporting ATPase subunit delta